ncbi:hypothetical protein LZ31DRAFT_636783 [Colletotrichum somersetense]|nr:hypothetical protein LZ31DRAFT_636783 [Colletotrichum somersetense]
MATHTLTKYNADVVWRYDDCELARCFISSFWSRVPFYGGQAPWKVVAATYLKLFTADIVYSGVPARCFYTGTVNCWNSACLGSNNSTSWSDLWGLAEGTVTAVDPRYDRLRSQVMVCRLVGEEPNVVIDAVVPVMSGLQRRQPT